MQFYKIILTGVVVLLPALSPAQTIKESAKVQIVSAYTPTTASFKEALRAGHDRDIIHFATPENVNVSISSADHPLQLAIEKKCQLQTIKYLVDLGADVNGKSFEGEYALYSAIKHERDDVVALLLFKGAALRHFDYKHSFLVEAARTGNLGITSMLLEQGINPNEINVWGESALDAASEKNNYKLCKLLIANGARPKDPQEQDYHYTSNDELRNHRQRDFRGLYYAVKNQNLKISRMFIKHGAKMDIWVDDSREEDSKSLLHAAVETGNKKTIKLLIRHGINVDNIEGRSSYVTPIQLAISKNDIAIVNLLVKEINLSDTLINSTTYLETAVRNNNLALFHQLVKKGASLQSKYPLVNNLFHVAAEVNNEELFWYLTKQGITVDSVRATQLLYNASETGNTTIARFALEHGAAINGNASMNYTPLSRAGAKQMQEFLIANGANPGDARVLETIESESTSGKVQAVTEESVPIPDQDIQTIAPPVQTAPEEKITLHQVADNYNNYFPDYDDRVAKAKELLEKGANVNEPDEYGNTPLGFALAAGDAQLTQLLLENGAKVNFSEENIHGFTPMQYAFETLNSSLFEVLLQYGADATMICDECGNTLLHKAAANGNVRFAALLLRYGASIDAVDSYGNTPLKAALQGDGLNADMLHLLLKNGARIDVQQDRLMLHQTFYNAIKLGDWRVCEILLSISVEADAVFMYNTMLYWAAFNNNEVLYNYLIKKGALPSRANLLLVAAIKNDMSLFRRYLKAGAVVHKVSVEISENELEESIFFGFEDESSLIPGAYISTIQVAYKNNNLKMVRALLRHGDDVNSKTLNGDATLLHMAVSKGDLATVRFLHKKGAILDVRNYFDRTPLFSASQSGDHKMVKYLLRKGADPQLKDRDGVTPLEAATREKHSKVVKLLENYK